MCTWMHVGFQCNREMHTVSISPWLLRTCILWPVVKCSATVVGIEPFKFSVVLEYWTQAVTDKLLMCCQLTSWLSLGMQVQCTFGTCTHTDTVLKGVESCSNSLYTISNLLSEVYWSLLLLSSAWQQAKNFLNYMLILFVIAY